MGQKCQKYFLESTYRKLSGLMQRSPYKIITDFGPCSCTNFSIKNVRFWHIGDFRGFFVEKSLDFQTFGKSLLIILKMFSSRFKDFWLGFRRFLTKIEPDFWKIFLQGCFFENFWNRQLFEPKIVDFRFKLT